MAQVEQAGGHSSCDGQLKSGLDVEIKEHDQRTQVGLFSNLAFQRRLYVKDERW